MMMTEIQMMKAVVFEEVWVFVLLMTAGSAITSLFHRVLSIGAAFEGEEWLKGSSLDVLEVRRK